MVIAKGKEARSKENNRADRGERREWASIFELGLRDRGIG